MTTGRRGVTIIWYFWSEGRNINLKVLHPRIINIGKNMTILTFDCWQFPLDSCAVKDTQSKCLICRKLSHLIWKLYLISLPRRWLWAKNNDGDLDYFWWFDKNLDWLVQCSPEDNSHVVWSAPAARQTGEKKLLLKDLHLRSKPVEIIFSGGGYEVVAAARLELHLLWRRREAPETILWL